MNITENEINKLKCFCGVHKNNADNDCTIVKIVKENAELKQQLDRLHKNEIIYHKRLADIKYLNRDEVEKIFNSTIFIDEDMENKNIEIFGEDKTITAICNLAIKPTTKDKIVKVLKAHEYFTLVEIINHPEEDNSYITFEHIANEILNDKDNI